MNTEHTNQTLADLPRLSVCSVFTRGSKQVLVDVPHCRRVLYVVKYDRERIKLMIGVQCGHNEHD